MGVAVMLRDEATQRLANQLASRQTQQAGGFQVALQNVAGLAERQVTHRRHVVQVLVAASLNVQRHLNVTQLLVLHLQFNLVHLQFVQGFAHGVCRQVLAHVRWYRAAGASCFLGALAQRNQVFFMRWHG